MAQRVARGWLARRRAAALREDKRQRDAVRIQAGRALRHSDHMHSYYNRRVPFRVA